MNIDETDSVDIGIDEKLNESFRTCVSLDNFVPLTEQEVSQLTEDYQNTEPKKGDCHIFDYQKFEKMAKRLPPRKGSEKDAARLKYDFSQLNLDVHQHYNLTYEETFHVLTEASRKDYSKSKYFFCCFLTHGGENGGLWAKDKRMCIDDILNIFLKSSSLKGIPKILIIEACQGKEAELVAWTDSTDSCILVDTEEFPDFLIVNSTYSGTVSFKTSNINEEKCHGSFFIDEFCCSLEEFSNRLDLLQILTIVNWRMANIFLSHSKCHVLDKKKQMPCFYSTLKEKVKFNKNIKPFVSEDTQWFDKRRKRHGSGHDSTNDPHSNRYCIKKAENALFLSIADENIFKKDSLLRSAVNLTTHMRDSNYSHEAFKGKFKRSKILQFLNKSSSRSGSRVEFKAKSPEVDCLICYVAAYSRYDLVCDADGRKITKKEIVEKFIGQLAKSFIGKPKIFIFLLRKLHEEENLPGERFSEDVEREPVIALDTSIETSSRRFHSGTDSVDGVTDQSMYFSDRELNTNTDSTNGECIGKKLIPIHADILEICITVRDWEQAIEPMKLFQDILKKSQTEDLLSLLTEFNYELFEKHDFFKMSKSFCMTSTLTKTLCLP